MIIYGKCNDRHMIIIICNLFCCSIFFLFENSVVTYMATQDTNTMKKELNSFIQETETFNDLLPMLRMVPKTQIQQFLIQLNKHNKINHKNWYWKFIVSINTIIPQDLTQYILSFLGLDLQNTKLVNKQWKKLSEINERQCYLKILKKNNLSIQDKQVSINILRHPFNKLSRVEKEMGFDMIPSTKYPMDDTQITVDLSSIVTNNENKSLMVIIMYPGSYKIDQSIILNVNVSLIGIPGSINGYYYKPPEIYCDVPFSKRILHHGYINITNGHKLSIQRCEISSAGCTLNVERDSSLFIRNSIIASSHYCSAIRITSKAKIIDITNSTFKNCQHCIKLIKEQYQKYSTDGIHQLICKCNVFTNIESYAIIQIRRDDERHRHYDRESQTQDFELDTKLNRNVFQIANNKWNYQYPLEWTKGFKHNHNQIYSKKY